jgi:hypothetical protein
VMVRLVRHRQTKEADTDRPGLRPPRHTLTLPNLTCACCKPMSALSMERTFVAENLKFRFWPNPVTLAEPGHWIKWLTMGLEDLGA